MKGKSLISFTLAALILLPSRALSAGKTAELWTRSEGDGGYVTVRVPYPEGTEMNWSQYRYLTVCYGDTGEPVALSSEYEQGYFFATVPAKDAGRSLKVVQSEPRQFLDCITVWRNEEYYDAPFGADQLDIRGIIQGDNQGNLNPDQVINRAEAFTILCRLLSLEPGGDPGFADVSPEDWYYETASAAKAAGLTAETEYFAPTRPVTRGEFTLMLYRAMKTIGWLRNSEEEEQTLSVADADAVPAWAWNAYTAFGQWNLGIFTCRDTGELDEFGAPVQEILAQQEAGAGRGEIIEFIYNVLRLLPVYPTQTAVEWGFDREMPAIDGSTSTLPYTNAVYSALFTNSSKHPSHPRKHSKSYYSYERLINGEADILFVSTKPTTESGTGYSRSTELKHPQNSPAQKRGHNDKRRQPKRGIDSSPFCVFPVFQAIINRHFRNRYQSSQNNRTACIAKSGRPKKSGRDPSRKHCQPGRSLLLLSVLLFHLYRRAHHFHSFCIRKMFAFHSF